VFGHKWEYCGNYWEQRDERIKQQADKKKATEESKTEGEGEPADQ
jgi:hypothetical protein